MKSNRRVWQRSTSRRSIVRIDQSGYCSSRPYRKASAADLCPEDASKYRMSTRFITTINLQERYFRSRHIPGKIHFIRLVRVCCSLSGATKQTCVAALLSSCRATHDFGKPKTDVAVQVSRIGHPQQNKVPIPTKLFTLGGSIFLSESQIVGHLNRK